MKYINFILMMLLLAACQEQQSGSPDATLAPAIETDITLSPDDPGYVAEDPRLTRLIGTPGPAITLQAIDGSEINLLDIYGEKPVYLKLWATFCIPCRAQMPGFEQIYQEFGDRMLVVAVNAGVGDDVRKVEEFAADEGINMPVAIDDGSLGAWLRMQETPLSLVIGLDGRIVYAGHQDGPQLHAALHKALDRQAADTSVETAAVTRLAALNIGDRVPDITLHSADGTPVQLSAESGPRAVLFTAVWCEDYLLQTEPQTAHNCQRVREQVSQLVQSGQLEWLGIVSHLWTTPDVLAGYEEQTSQPLPFAIDTDGTAFRVFGIRRFPAVALIDAEGRLLGIVGPDDDDLVSVVQAMGSSR